MAISTQPTDGRWSSRWLFVLAAAGSAVGLGNIWKFPYIAGENGGGAFVLIYLVCVAFVGAPIMISEVMLGRKGRASPINTMGTLAKQASASGRWGFVGWMGVLAGVLILSYYAVIAGWALNYVWLTASGTFDAASAQVATSTFDQLQQDPLQMVAWHSLFIFITIWIVARGVSRGLETAIRWFMPLLFVLLLVLLGYSASSGGFAQGWAFMFDFNWDVVGPETWLIAMGQAFFTLSLGMGTMMAYGAYVPDDSHIGSTVLTIVVLDTFVAVAAGLAIFPLVFVNGLEVGQGPGLMFVTLPLAFGQLPMGALFGTVFFVLVSFAAITSAISLTEPAIAYLVEEYNAKRSRVAVSLGVFCWLLGLGTVFSFNIWADVKPLFGLNFFEIVDQLSQNIMLPLGGLLIALFAVWVLPQNIVREQLQVRSDRIMLVWRVVGGVIAPLGVAAVFIYTLLPLFMG
ncbi:MAG: sodium-dependent transporter [Pseudomonadota bacterium]|nr:sodium-dependent transporter [Pseudomonadota bacterium]MEC7250648.1 sodium-dependent transporter [Pseudomonadota bacterium]MEC7379753.1 sodium-dependent transporter [Pseudomonadota bacterium]MEC7412779.1 sodium-dependent transporter [Pseudomonadota bacterium]MEC7420014.1 sodium-dependent transporter [Pseudomonadota bacterium]|tara:strand:- start:381 stop:1754 length:1374 start_codon:yes stop_codon:yes gene_type:complete